jgi:hypothetical protein
MDSSEDPTFRNFGYAKRGFGRTGSPALLLVLFPVWRLTAAAASQDDLALVRSRLQDLDETDAIMHRNQRTV